MRATVFGCSLNSLLDLAASFRTFLDEQRRGYVTMV
jgi:hypothetical protein